MGLPVLPDSEVDEGIGAALRHHPPIAPGQQQRAWEAVRRRAAEQTPLPALDPPPAADAADTPHLAVTVDASHGGSLRDTAARLWHNLTALCFDDKAYMRACIQHQSRGNRYSIHSYFAYSMFDVAA